VYFQVLQAFVIVSSFTKATELASIFDVLHIFLKLYSSWLDEKGWMKMNGYIVNSVVSFASGS